MPSGKWDRDTVGWLGGSIEDEDQKKPFKWACARQYKVTGRNKE